MLQTYCSALAASYITPVTYRQETAMTPSEQQLISGLFDRMRGFGSPEKDPEAEALINKAVQQIPDAPYMLVQSVLVQEHALQQADQRIRELESRVNELEAQAEEAPAQQGGFLGGLFGGGPRPAPPSQRMSGSVPSAGGRLGSGASGRSGPIGAPGRGPFGQQPQAAPGGGGGFLQSAMATAAGVAGGMLLANSISSMLGGGSAEASKGSEQPEQDQPQETADAGADEDANVQDASYESDSGDWGGDWGGGDFEI